MLVLISLYFKATSCELPIKDVILQSWNRYQEQIETCERMSEWSQVQMLEEACDGIIWYDCVARSTCFPRCSGTSIFIMLFRRGQGFQLPSLYCSHFLGYLSSHPLLCSIAPCSQLCQPMYCCPAILYGLVGLLQEAEVSLRVGIGPPCSFQ